MATLNTSVPTYGTIGGETCRIGDTVRSLSGINRKVDVQANIPGATSATYVTLWDSAASPMTTFLRAVIEADPESLRSDDQDIDIRITINAITPIFRMDKNKPLALGPSAQGTGAITKIEAANLATTVAGTDDVQVRLALFGT